MGKIILNSIFFNISVEQPFFFWTMKEINQKEKFFMTAFRTPMKLTIDPLRRNIEKNRFSSTLIGNRFRSQMSINAIKSFCSKSSGQHERKPKREKTLVRTFTKTRYFTVPMWLTKWVNITYTMWIDLHIAYIVLVKHQCLTFSRCINIFCSFYRNSRFLSAL